jgi:hypothetical protein
MQALMGSSQSASVDKATIADMLSQTASLHMQLQNNLAGTLTNR